MQGENSRHHRKGKITQAKESIIRILEVRFEAISQELRELIGKIEDIEVLGTLLVQAVTTQSLETFESVVNQFVTEEGSELENREQNSGEGEKGM
jgi:uncharacterized protein YaaR (DUF327 family)